MKRFEDFEEPKSYEELNDYEVQKYSERNGLNVEKCHEIEPDEKANIKGESEWKMKFPHLSYFTMVNF